MNQLSGVIAWPIFILFVPINAISRMNLIQHIKSLDNNN